MIPIKQTILSSVDGNIRGNCFRACLASMLEIPNIDDIPAFEQMSNETWFQVFYKWLVSVGYQFHGTGHPDGKKEFEYEGIDGYYMAVGKSPREYVKAGHGVVYKQGKLVHDPHPNNEGILTFDSFYMIEKIEENKDENKNIT